MAELHHECGVAALYCLDLNAAAAGVPANGEVSRLMPRVLLDLQNRGQLAAGMTSYNPGRELILDTYKQLGTVSEALRLARAEKAEQIMGSLAGQAALGHVRYATCGADRRDYAQPFERQHGCRWK